MQTGQEANAMLRAVSDGKSGRYWQTVAGADSRVHQVPGAAHRVQIVLTDGERELGVPVKGAGRDHQPARRGRRFHAVVCIALAHARATPRARHLSLRDH